MKRFEWREIHEAYAYAAAGGQALHCHRIIPDPDRAPECFVRAVRGGGEIAHLFDLNLDRLVATARSLGVRVIYVDAERTPRQHIDLCGAPLRRALEVCELPPTLFGD